MSWKKLTQVDGYEVLTNLARANTVIRIGDQTYVNFGSYTIQVKETPNDIAMAEPLRFK